MVGLVLAGLPHHKPRHTVDTDQRAAPGMKKLLTLVGEQAVDVVLIEYPDRLTLWFSYLDQAFGGNMSALKSSISPKSRSQPKS